MSRRITRINDEIKEQTAVLIRDLKDPRLNSFITVIRADTTQDLKYCKIYVSIMGTEEEKKESIEVLKNSSGFIKKQLAVKVNLRQTPNLIFLLDESLDHAMRIQEILDEIK
ncbi:MAG: 30S ribosome-binding factor RbfA [Defluviitaleaceae bacterium]|nr:30S ribosome-binding factor RbfA [Defluviitaleaceae bacterium]